MTIKCVGPAKLHADGLSPRDIAKSIARVAHEASDQDLMTRIRELYGLAGKLAKEIQLKSPTWGPGVFSATEFSALVGAFVASIKKHYDVSIEETSTANRLMSAVQRHDIETMCKVEEDVVSFIRQLSESDASGFMFHFFWPQLYGELYKSDTSQHDAKPSERSTPPLCPNRPLRNEARRATLTAPQIQEIKLPAAEKPAKDEELLERDYSVMVKRYSNTYRGK